MFATLSALSLAAVFIPFVAGQATHQVTVGAGGLVYNPTSITAAAGDKVIFTFSPGNHTATQGSFATPCLPLAGGANSGFMPTASSTFEYDVKGTDPVWFYCAQVSHCQTGMVFAINPTASQTFDLYQQIAEGKASASASGSASSTAATPTTSAASGGGGIYGGGGGGGSSSGVRLQSHGVVGSFVLGAIILALV